MYNHMHYFLLVKLHIYINKPVLTGHNIHEEAAFVGLAGVESPPSVTFRIRCP